MELLLGILDMLYSGDLILVDLSRKGSLIGKNWIRAIKGQMYERRFLKIYGFIHVSLAKLKIVDKSGYFLIQHNFYKIIVWWFWPAFRIVALLFVAIGPNAENRSTFLNIFLGYFLTNGKLDNYLYTDKLPD